MMSQKKVITSSLALILALTSVANATGNFTGTVTVVHFNDVHGSLTETSTSIGYPKIATFIDAQRTVNPNTLVLDAGDVIAGNPSAALDKGVSFATILNTVGIDAMTAGNAEFSYGSAVLRDFSQQINYPMFVPNMVERTTRTPFGPGYTIITLANGMKAGIFGVTTPDAAGMGTIDYEYIDAVSSAQQQVNVLRTEGVDLVIGLVHLGELNSVANVLDVADRVTGIDLLVDGHTHTVYPAGTERNGVLIVQTGAYGENIGTVNLEFAEGQLIGKKAQLHPRDEFENIPEKGSTRVALDNFEVRLGHFFDSNVGATSVVLEGSRNILRTQETNLGNLFTDAIRQNSGADLALYPAGNISGPIGPGPIVRRDVYTLARLDVEVVVQEMSGAQILEFLTDASKLYPEPSGYFLQISGGTYRLDTSTAPVTVHSVTVAGAPIEPEKLYSVAVEIGATVLPGVSGTRQLSNVGYVAPLIEEYIRTLGSVAPTKDGRIFVD